LGEQVLTVFAGVETLEQLLPKAEDAKQPVVIF
jgi:hypothetical protein